MALPISVEDHVDSCHAPASSPSSSRLITHFYVKKMEEEQIREVERAAASTATDHGQEVVYVCVCICVCLFDGLIDCSHLPDLMLCSSSPVSLYFCLSRFWEWSESRSTSQKAGEASRLSCRTHSSATLAPSWSTLCCTSTWSTPRNCTKPSHTL